MMDPVVGALDYIVDTLPASGSFRVCEAFDAIVEIMVSQPVGVEAPTIMTLPTLRPFRVKHSTPHATVWSCEHDFNLNCRDRRTIEVMCHSNVGSIMKVYAVVSPEDGERLSDMMADGDPGTIIRLSDNGGCLEITGGSLPSSVPRYISRISWDVAPFTLVTAGIELLHVTSVTELFYPHRTIPLGKTMRLDRYGAPECEAR